MVDQSVAHPCKQHCFGAWTESVGLLRLIEKAEIECPLEVDVASYFLSTIELRPSDAPGMSRWRKRLFSATSRITADAAEYFRLPRDRTLVMGSLIDV